MPHRPQSGEPIDPGGEMELGSPTISHGRITVPLKPGAAGQYFTERELWVDYGDTDLSGLDPAVAILPALGTVVPVALAAGVAVRVPEVDAVFAGQAAELAAAMRHMYPHFPTTGFEIRGGFKAGRDRVRTQRAALLYSGGIDSVTSLLRHRDTVDCLVSVWGADVEVEDSGLWQQLQKIIERAPARPGTRRVVARTNIRRALDELRLNRHFDHGFPPVTTWWGGVQHGVALTTLVAPIAEIMGLGRVLIASSHSVEYQPPWGSDPELDEAVRWTGGVVEHDAIELNRQRKISDVVVPWLQSGNQLILAVCYKVTRGGETMNCGHCEKCMRTVTAMLAAGSDPTRAGIPVSAESLDTWRRRMDSGELHFAHDIPLWQDIQREIRPAGAGVPAVPGSAEYLKFIKAFDLPNMGKPGGAARAVVGRMPTWRYLALRGAHRIPYAVRRRLRSRVLR